MNHKILSYKDTAIHCMLNKMEFKKSLNPFDFVMGKHANRIKDNESHMYNLYHHHHHVVSPARISLILSRHFSLSFIAFGRSSGLYPVSSHNCCMYVRAGRPAFAWPYAGVHRSTSLMSSSSFLQQCPACLVRLTCIVFVMGGKWPYIWRLVGCAMRIKFI